MRTKIPFQRHAKTGAGSLFFLVMLNILVYIPSYARKPIKKAAITLANPSCYVDWNASSNKTTITISSEMTTGGGALTALKDGDASTNGFWFTNSQAIANKEVLKFVFPSAAIINGIEIVTNTPLNNNATYRIEGSNNGTDWTDLTGTLTFSSTATAPVYGASGNSRKFPIAGNTTPYLQYRIYGISGTTANNWTHELYFGSPTLTLGLSDIDNNYGSNTSITTDDQITFKLNPQGGTGTYAVAVSSGSVTPTTGTYGTTTSFSLQPGSAGAGNVTLTLTNTTSNCDLSATIVDPGVTPFVDTDGDGLGNKVDLDDDNDGILDTVEDAYCAAINYNTNLTNKAKIKLSTTATVTGSIDVLLDGNVANNSFYYTGATQAVANKTYVKIDFLKPTLLKGFELAVGAYVFANGTVMKVQGSNDGSTWTDLLTSTRTATVAACAYGTCDNAETFNFSSNTTSYKSYRLYGVSGTSRQSPWINELFVHIEAASLCDFDGDGIANSLDLDSDNDGIPDNVEAQPTLTYIASNADNAPTYLTNNGVNSAYLGGLTPPDTDGDGCEDFLDTDSDGDLELDKNESGLTFNGVPGLNGLDSGSETADTYEDVNGIVDSPKNILSSTNPGVGEAKYREIPPLKRTITVCYKSGLQYGIGGGDRNNAADKLLNAANFSLTGTSTFTFKMVAFSTAFTKSGLEAQGCQIVDLGISNTDAGSASTHGTYTDTEENELIAWTTASKSNMILAFQGYATRLGGSGYVGSGNNTNPNSLTTLGQKIIEGPFGTVASFNQGGGFQGAYDQIPTTSCVLVQDNSTTKRNTGVLDKLTGDVYLADVGLIGETGGLTTGNAITSNTDKFFANLYHSLAKLVVYAPNDPCTYFECAAGEHAPTLSTTSISGSGTVNLNSITTSNLPSGTSLTWHTATPATSDNKIANPSAYPVPGTVYAAFHDSALDCYSGGGAATTAVVVSAALPQANLSVAVTAPTSKTGAKGQQLTYTVTLTNAGPATATNVVVDVPIPTSAVTLLSASAGAGTYNSLTHEWSVPSLAVGSTTLTFTVKVN